MLKIVRITTVPISLDKLLGGQLKYMQKFYKVSAVSSNKELLEEFGKTNKVDTFFVDLTRKITPIKDANAVVKLYLYLKKEKPDIVHTHTPKAGIVGMLASYFAKVPNRLHTVAGLPLLEANGFKRDILNFVEKLTYLCATKIYPNSNGLKQIILQNRFVKKDKLKLIANGSSNGIDTSYFNPALFSHEENMSLKNRLGIIQDDFVFIFVGRVVGDKGINELLSAFENLSTKKKDVKLLLIGPFEDQLDPLQDKSKEIINSNKQIIYVGYQNDVRPFFAVANVLTFPSYREGFPNVVMQAGAMGLPSIVTDINGCNEIIKNGENGIIIPVKNVFAIQEAMELIMQDSVLFEKLKQNARVMIKSRYEQHMVWRALLDEYNRLIEERNNY